MFTDAQKIPDDRLQDLAREMNYSETVFVCPAQGDGHVHIRIFTPSTELPFAGHPVLGTAFVLAAPLQLLVINLETGLSAVVTIKDRGPYVKGRIVDLSPATAQAIGISVRQGIAKVVVSPITVPLPDGGVKYGAAIQEARLASNDTREFPPVGW